MILAASSVRKSGTVGFFTADSAEREGVSNQDLLPNIKPALVFADLGREPEIF
jgi:hypothetical protein